MAGLLRVHQGRKMSIKFTAESFKGEEHLAQIQAEAREIVNQGAGLTKLILSC